MKQLFTTALLGAMCAFGAYAQQVVVTTSEGATTKFSADRVKEITFVNTGQTVGETVTFNSASISGSTSMVFLYLNAEDGTQLETFICSESNVAWLSEGVFNPSPSNTPMTWDNGGYTFVTKDGNKQEAVDGTFTVSRIRTEYTIVAELTLEDGSIFKGQYVGELPNYCPVMTADLSNLTVVDNNGRVPGEFYLKLNDTNWNWSVTFDLFAEASATTIPAGTYTRGEAGQPFHYGPLSKIECYSPYFTLEPSEALTVDFVGDEIHISGVFNSENGAEVTINYQGPITYLDPITEEKIIHFNEFDYMYYGANVTMKFSNPEWYMQLDIYRPDSSDYIHTGVYTVTDGMDDFNIDSNNWYTYISPADDMYERLSLESGTMTVSREGQIYTLLFDFVLDDGSTFKGDYIGELEGFGGTPGVMILDNPTSVIEKTDVNDLIDGEHYLKLHDAGYGYEMVLDLYADPAEANLPAGTYSISNERVPGSLYFTRSSIDIYSPHNLTGVKFAEGSYVTVSYEGSDIVLNIHLVLTENNKVVDLTYTGPLTIS